MIGEGTALLETEQGSLIITMTHEIGSSLIIYHSPSHTRVRFHSCTGRQSRIVLSPMPRLAIINRIHTFTSFIHTTS